VLQARKLLGAALGIRVARTLYARWRLLTPTDRARLEPLAEDAKRRALDLRGSSEPDDAGLQAANENLAAAMIETAEADPDLSEIEVGRLREDLRRELERLSSGEIAASRGAPHPGASQPEPRG
jgi:hypothetical protein